MQILGKVLLYVNTFKENFEVLHKGLTIQSPCHTHEQRGQLLYLEASLRNTPSSDTRESRDLFSITTVPSWTFLPCLKIWTLTPDQCVSSQTSTEKSLSAAGGSCHRAHSWSYTERKRLQNAPSCVGQLLHTAPFQAQRPKWKSDRKTKIQRQWMISRKECFLDTARQMPMQANRDCGCDSACKTPAGSSQMKSPHREWVVGTKSCPEPRATGI